MLFADDPEDRYDNEDEDEEDEAVRLYSQFDKLIADADDDLELHPEPDVPEDAAYG